MYSNKKTTFSIYRGYSQTLFFIVLIFILFFSHHTYASIDTLSELNAEKIKELLNEHYVDNIFNDINDNKEDKGEKKTEKEKKEEEKEEKTIDYYLNKLDDHSQLMNTKEEQSFTENVNAEYEGIGILMQEVENGLVVLQVFEGGGAEEAGVKSGDILQYLVTEDGEISLYEIPMEKSVHLIRGEEGTFVEVVMLRGEENKEKRIERRKVQAPMVLHKRLGGNIGYIQIRTFGRTVGREFEVALRDLKDTHFDIIDLKNNVGGYISGAQQIAGLFEGVEKLFVSKSRDDKETIYYPFKQDPITNKESIILANKYTASASEILASALRDYNISLLYGQQTYGKGSMQSIFRIDNENSLKLTTARFLSAKRNEINGVGLTPDEKTKEGKELVIAHKDLLDAMYHSYEEIEKIELKEGTKILPIIFSNSINERSLEKKIKIIEIGGEKVESEIVMIGRRIAGLRLERGIERGGEYRLYIHPGIEGVDGSVLEGGYKIDITAVNDREEE